MQNILNYFDYIKNEKLHEDDATPDLNHALLLFGAVLSFKPENVLEFGIGRGFTSFTMLRALQYNRRGKLTCVDNYGDINGNLRYETMDKLRAEGVNVIAPMAEKDFVKNCPDNSYDFLMSDGDHHNAGDWADDIFRIMKPDSFMFFHDADNQGFPSIKNYSKRAKELNLPHFMFNKSSRDDEGCDISGFLFIINKK